MTRTAAVVLAIFVGACGGDDGTGPNDGEGIVLVRRVPIEPEYGIHDTFVRDGVAFVSAWNTGMIVLDVGGGGRGGTPAQPVELSRLVTGSSGVPGGGSQTHNAWWFHNPTNAERRYLFVGQEGPGVVGQRSLGDIHVLDVSDLAEPVEVAFFHMPPVEGQSAGTHNFWMDEAAQVLYAAYYNGGVIALDVSGALEGDLVVRLLGSQRFGSGSTYTWGVQLANGSLYASDMLSGFWQLDPAPATLATRGGGGNVPDRFGSDLWVHGNHAYTGTWGDQKGVPGNVVNIWRLGETGAPAIADSIVIEGAGTISDLEVSSDGAFLLVTTERGAAAGGLYLYALTDPENPTLLDFEQVGTGLHTGTFATIGGRRYVFAAKNPGEPALMIFDVTDIAPLTP